MKYVLIAYMTWASTGGAFTAEFDDKAACEAAVAIWDDGLMRYPSPRDPRVIVTNDPQIAHAICVPKGTTP